MASASQPSKKYLPSDRIAAIRAVVGAGPCRGDHLVFRNILLFLKQKGVVLGTSAVKCSGPMTKLEQKVHDDLHGLSHGDASVATFNGLTATPDQAYLDDREGYIGWKAWTPWFVLNEPFRTAAAALCLVCLIFLAFVAFNSPESTKTVFAGSGNGKGVDGEPSKQEGDKSATTNDPNAELRKLVMQVTGDHGKLKSDVESLKTDVKNVGKKVDSTSTAVDDLKRDLPKMIQDGVSAGLSAQDKARSDDARKFFENGGKGNKLSTQKAYKAMESMAAQISENETENAALDAFAQQCLDQVNKLRAERLNQAPFILTIDGKPVQ